MKLVHYSGEIIHSLQNLPYTQNEMKMHCKPRGFWFSIESENVDEYYGWKEWCEAEDFQIENLKFSYEITLKDNSIILYIKTSEELLKFTKKYALKNDLWSSDCIH